MLFIKKLKPVEEDTVFSMNTAEHTHAFIMSYTIVTHTLWSE